MDGLEVILETPEWGSMLHEIAPRAVSQTLLYLGFETGGDVAILGCDDAKISQLNKAFRGKDTPTNVLSWPAAVLAPGDPPEPELGDIAIAYETCVREAAQQGKAMEDHVTHLLVHATLHLLGFDHENDAEAAQMEQVEVAVLGKLGLDDPY